MKYVTGDLFNHPITKETFIIHINNNVGVAGAGFVVPLYNKYPLGRMRYYSWAERGYYWTQRNFASFYTDQKKIPFELGQIQPVKINNIVIVNMIAQAGFPSKKNPVAVSYLSLSSCLEKVSNICKDRDCEVICPLIGAGIGGGDWDIIEQMLIEAFDNNQIPLTVYQLPGEELR